MTLFGKIVAILNLVVTCVFFYVLCLDVNVHRSWAMSNQPMDWLLPDPLWTTNGSICKATGRWMTSTSPFATSTTRV